MLCLNLRLNSPNSLPLLVQVVTISDLWEVLFAADNGRGIQLVTRHLILSPVHSIAVLSTCHVLVLLGQHRGDSCIFLRSQDMLLVA